MRVRRGKGGYRPEEPALFDEEGNPIESVRVRMPDRRLGQMFAIADQLMGAGRIRIICADGETRIGRIRGKMRRRMWVRTGELLIIMPWEVQPIKADIMYRYTRTQSTYLSRKKMIPEIVDVF